MCDAALVVPSRTHGVVAQVFAGRIALHCLFNARYTDVLDVCRSSCCGARMAGMVDVYLGDNVLYSFTASRNSDHKV